MKRIPLIRCGDKVYFYADEFICKCGKCRYSDPTLIPYIISPILKEHLFELRYETGIPIIITRGVSCFKHHKNIYKRIYGIHWENFITWDSSHVPDKEKRMHGGQSEIFYGTDNKPLTNNYFNFFASCVWFRFTGIIWYKKRIKHFFKPNESINSFIHTDNHPIRHKLYANQKTYYLAKKNIFAGT